MGQIVVPGTPPSILLTAIDRLQASNAGGGVSPLASHIILLGEDAGENLGDLDNIIVLGDDSFSGGLANPSQTGSTVIGSNIFPLLTNVTPSVNDGPIIAIGQNIGPNVVNRTGNLILIGDEIANDAPATAFFDTSVVIGHEALERQSTASGNFARRLVAVGYRVLRGGAFTFAGAGTSINESVFIGSEAGEAAGFNAAVPGCTLEGTIAIGYRALANVNNVQSGSTEFTIAIGQECADTSRTSDRCIWIGALIDAPTTGALMDVIVGAGINAAHTSNAGQHVVIGAEASILGLGSRCIFIGSQASAVGMAAASSDHLLIETAEATGGLRRCLVYGNMGTETAGAITACGIAFGLSGAANRDLPGMNIVKIIDGSATAAVPVGGGFLYSSAGALHWKDTAGADYALTPAASLGNFTVATLPAAPALGSRGFATDALAPAFGAAVAGGGAVFVPVFYNGAAWIVG